MPKKPVTDVFGLWQIEGETNFEGDFEIPVIIGTDQIPKDLVSFSNAKKEKTKIRKQFIFTKMMTDLLESLIQDPDWTHLFQTPYPYIKALFCLILVFIEIFLWLYNSSKFIKVELLVYI
jgi:hypothetical protein